jgi:ABC-type multidrug transport system ATPase subunit
MEEQTTTETHSVPPVEIKFESLNYSVIVKKKPRALLKNVSACIESGKLTAIMGPSGR